MSRFPQRTATAFRTVPPPNPRSPTQHPRNTSLVCTDAGVGVGSGGRRFPGRSLSPHCVPHPRAKADIAARCLRSQGALCPATTRAPFGVTPRPGRAATPPGPLLPGWGRRRPGPGGKVEGHTEGGRRVASRREVGGRLGEK